MRGKQGAGGLLALAVTVVVGTFLLYLAIGRGKARTAAPEQPPFIDRRLPEPERGPVDASSLALRIAHLASELQTVEHETERLLKARQELQRAAASVQKLEQKSAAAAGANTAPHGGGGGPVRPVPAADSSSSKPRFRADGRCGHNFPAPGAPNFGECDPGADADQKGPCCRPDSGYCGNVRGVDWGHCDCADCVDYSLPPNKRRKPASVAVAAAEATACDRAFSLSAALHSAWEPLRVCGPLFSDTDYTTHKDTLLECRTNAQLRATTCMGRNLVVDIKALQSASSSKGLAKGACTPALSVASAETGIADFVQPVAVSVASQDRSATDLSVCSSWVKDPVIIVGDTQVTRASLFSSFQSWSVFADQGLVDSTDGRRFLFLHDAGETVAPGLARMPVPTVGASSVCFEKVIFAHAGSKSALQAEASLGPCSDSLSETKAAFEAFLQ